MATAIDRRTNLRSWLPTVGPTIYGPGLKEGGQCNQRNMTKLLGVPLVGRLRAEYFALGTGEMGLSCPALVAAR
jgi:hypothetical protein